MASYKDEKHQTIDIKLFESELEKIPGIETAFTDGDVISIDMEKKKFVIKHFIFEMHPRIFYFFSKKISSNRKTSVCKSLGDTFQFKSLIQYRKGINTSLFTLNEISYNDKVNPSNRQPNKILE